MLFAVPMIWRKSTDQNTGCYICMVPTTAKELSNKKKRTVQYPNILSTFRPVQHNEDIPFPEVEIPVSYVIESDYWKAMKP